MVSNIFILDQHLKTKLILSINGSNTFFKDLYDLDLSTGTESYEFSTTAEDIEESDYIMFLYKGDYKLFQIIDIEQEHREGKIITSVYGESACLELLNDVAPVMAGPQVMNAVQFVHHVLDGSEWQLKKYSSSLGRKQLDINIDKSRQRWTTLQDYMKDFGYEIATRVKYENGHVKAKYIDIYAEGELGNKTYKRFEYSRNVKGITKKKDLYDFCTALILNTKQNMIDIQYGEVSGDTLKPKDGFFKSPKSDRLLATDNNKTYNLGKPYIFGIYEDNNSNSASETLNKAIAELKIRSVPKFDYECDTALTYEEYEDISIGDTVYVIDHTFNPVITLEARVGKLEISFTDRDNCKCTLTNYKEIKSKVGSGIDDIKELLDRTTIKNKDEEEVTIKDDYLGTKEKVDELENKLNNHLKDCEECGCHDGDNDGGLTEIPNPIQFYNGSDENKRLVGTIGSTTHSDGTSDVVYLKSEADSDIMIGSDILITDKDSNSSLGVTSRKGLNLLYPNLIFGMNFLTTGGKYSGEMHAGGLSLTVETNENDYYYVWDSLSINHKESISFNTNSKLFFFCASKQTDSDLTIGDHVGFYVPIDLNGNKIYNSGGLSDNIAPQSEYTTSLIDSGTDENMIYNNMSYDQDEVRWCWKETVFTYREADVDPETDEWVYTGRYICYVELPIFIAENIYDDYHINICKKSWGDYRIIEQNSYYFILESQEEDFAFTFEVVAKLVKDHNDDMIATSHKTYKLINNED